MDTVRQGGFRPTDRPPFGQGDRTTVDKVSSSSYSVISFESNIATKAKKKYVTLKLTAECADIA